MKTSIKFGSQYGCGEQLNCRIFITLFSYFNTAAVGQNIYLNMIIFRINFNFQVYRAEGSVKSNQVSLIGAVLALGARGCEFESRQVQCSCEN